MLAHISEGAIYQEAKLVKESHGKAIFKNIIQTADEINQNRRKYPKEVLDAAMRNNMDRMKRRALLGELDHPFPQGNQTFDQVRQTTVSLKDVSHIIRDFEWKGNKLYAEMETTTTKNGAILLGLLKDKSGIGFSMRGMAEIERKPGYNLVKDPLTIITFDCVSSPSHKAAVVDFNEMRFESEMLTEQSGMVCIDGRCFLPDYFDKLVETKIIKFFGTWV